MRMGGRVAELLVYGDLSTGAANDLVGNTELARKMVREWGMSEEIGPMAWGSQGQVFLGEDLMHTRDYSEDTEPGHRRRGRAHPARPGGAGHRGADPPPRGPRRRGPGPARAGDASTARRSAGWSTRPTAQPVHADRGEGGPPLQRRRPTATATATASNGRPPRSPASAGDRPGRPPWPRSPPSPTRRPARGSLAAAAVAAAHRGPAAPGPPRPGHRRRPAWPPPRPAPQPGEPRQRSRRPGLSAEGPGRRSQPATGTAT